MRCYIRSVQVFFGMGVNKIFRSGSYSWTLIINLALLLIKALFFYINPSLLWPPSLLSQVCLLLQLFKYPSLLQAVGTFISNILRGRQCVPSNCTCSSMGHWVVNCRNKKYVLCSSFIYILSPFVYHVFISLCPPPPSCHRIFSDLIFNWEWAFKKGGIPYHVH